MSELTRRSLLDRSTSAAAAALDALSSPGGEDTCALSRRRFLQLVGMGAGAGLTGNALVEAVCSLDPALRPEVVAAGSPGSGDGILVVVGMYGGNDGSNTVVHVGDADYYGQRGSLAIPASSTLRLDASTGLHPNLTTVKRFWDAGQLAVIEGVGYDDPSFSHFQSLAVWMSGVRHGPRPTGWIGRWLDEQFGGTADPYVAASIGSATPLHMIGASQRAATIGYEGYTFGGSIESWDLRMYEAVRSMASPAGRSSAHDRYTRTLLDQIDVGGRSQPFMPSETSGKEIVAKMEVAARLINAGLGFRVFDVGWRNFDQHADQPGTHGRLLADFDEAIRRFYSLLAPEMAARVAVMTFSEFGRTPFANAAKGTDHGSSSCALVLGANVRGGRYGSHPTLAGLQRWDRPGHSVDFRSYYSSVIDGWLGGGSAGILGGNFDDLGLFERSPGAGSEKTPFIGPKPPAAASEFFVPTTPTRIVDTRDGTGGSGRRPLASGESIRVPATDLAGLPSGASAVVANVTVARSSASTHLTLSPSGTPRPEVSTVNGRPGAAVANATVMALGDGGAFDVFNANGDTDVVIDVFGYLSAQSGQPVEPVDPYRLLDTRTGVGGVSGRVGRNQRVELHVAGRGGVPTTGVTSVAVNVTVAAPTSRGHLVTGASGQPLPSTSNVNFQASQTVPNLVFCEVGTNGKISLLPFCESAHLIVDVFAWFGPAASGLLRSVDPVRLLDTRSGLGAPERQVGAIHFVRLQVANRAAVPREATAALLNVTAVGAKRPLHVTVWPSESPTPTSSNLNVRDGRPVANLVLCRLGPSGQLDISSPISHVDVIADVLGFVGPRA